MAHLKYVLGRIDDVDPLNPPAKYIDKKISDGQGNPMPRPCNTAEVIAHYTWNSLVADWNDQSTRSARNHSCCIAGM